MVDPARSTGADNPIGPPSPQLATQAQLALSANRLPGGGVDVQGLAASVARVRQENPQSAGWVEAEIDRNLTPVERGELARTLEGGSAPAPANDAGPDPVTLGLDLTQLALDITGIIEPTPISDGSNTIISAGRAIGSLFSGDFGGAGGHALNGVLSAAGIIPYLGDAAKAGKVGKWAETISESIGAVVANPALRGALEPALRQVKNAVDAIPQGAIDALPGSARDAINRMKGQLDEFFGASTRQADEGIYQGTVRGQGVELRGVDSVSVNYVKRDRVEYAALRRDFDSTVRGDFLRDLAGDPAKVDALRRAGLDQTAIDRIASGRVPQGWQVHHKLPLDDGGTNSFDNLVLIRNDPHHIALTNAQRTLVGDLGVGQSRQVDFPIPRGFVYPPAP
ncbi:HNH endonuclease [Sphingomonas gei]|uniref:HNH endonuclease n=1 Tax=Sphingomonas gei TaxID=1395960 RepID=A0A4S1XFV7_9SPHN|nr:HNH endonuclease [Sphingomonas gei]TGX54971.1 HNH endonuclease [Sphingomonas gei]